MGSASDKEGEFKFCAECGMKFYRKSKIGRQDWFTRKFCGAECSRDSQKRQFKVGKGRTKR